MRLHARGRRTNTVTHVSLQAMHFLLAMGNRDRTALPFCQSKHYTFQLLTEVYSKQTNSAGYYA